MMSVAVGIVAVGVVFFTAFSASAKDYCVSDKCKEAAKKEAEMAAAMNEANAAADSLQGEIARLANENAVLSAQIAKGEAEAEDLQNQIDFNQKKLLQEQEALAMLLVEMHFDRNEETIMLLASSDTISDLAEKQARKETVKNEVNIAAQAVRDLKDQLIKDKEVVEAKVKELETKRKELVANIARSTNLMNEYRDNADAFAAVAAEARAIKNQEISNEIAKYNSTGQVVASGNNTYPWKGNCPRENNWYITFWDNGDGTRSAWGNVCQCTSYAGYKAWERWRVNNIYYWGDAKNWVVAARARGYRVDTNPAEYTVAVSTDGIWGHVMWVEGVNGNGTINLSEYNNGWAAGHDGDFSVRYNVPIWGLWFIHFSGAF